MKQTKEEKAIYQAAWRLRNPGYQLDHRAWLRVEHAKMKAEFLARKPKKVKPTTRTDDSKEVAHYPWMDQT